MRWSLLVVVAACSSSPDDGPEPPDVLAGHAGAGQTAGASGSAGASGASGSAGAGASGAGGAGASGAGASGAGAKSTGGSSGGAGVAGKAGAGATGGGGTAGSTSGAAGKGVAGAAASGGTSGAAGKGGGSTTGGTSGAAGTSAGASGAAGTAGAAGGGAGQAGLSYMVGIKSNPAPDGPAKVEAWLGRPIEIAGTTINTNGYIGVGKTYVTASGAHPLLEVSFPLLSIYGEGNGATDMTQAAAGAYDTIYEKMASSLAASKNPLLSVRIGWEFNGNWYAWSKGVSKGATYATYLAAFKRAATIVRAKNPHVLVQWCVAWGQPDPTPYWPGAYDPDSNPGGVDVVSMDFYQGNISHYNNAGKTSTWQMAQSGATGSGPIVLDWMVEFAQKNKVKIALSEYGAGNYTSKGLGSGPGLDDGAWTQDSITWMNSLPPGLFLWALWSSDYPADDIVTKGANPKEQAAWVSAWGAKSYTGGWWTGPRRREGDRSGAAQSGAQVSATPSCRRRLV